MRKAIQWTALAGVGLSVSALAGCSRENGQWEPRREDRVRAERRADGSYVYTQPRTGTAVRGIVERDRPVEYGDWDPAGGPVISTPPPAPRPEVRPTATVNGQDVWVEGHWRFDGGEFYWVPGRYIANRAGHTFLPPHWRRVTGGWQFIEGGWIPAPASVPPESEPDTRLRMGEMQHISRDDIARDRDTARPRGNHELDAFEEP